jgi:hypothetical protein
METFTMLLLLVFKEMVMDVHFRRCKLGGQQREVSALSSGKMGKNNT